MKILYQRRLVLVQLIRTAQRYWLAITDPEMSVSILTDALPLYWLRGVMHGTKPWRSKRWRDDVYYF